MTGRIYKTIILDTDGDDTDPVLSVGVVGDQVYLSIGSMHDGVKVSKVKALSPEVQIPLADLMHALGLVPNTD